MRYPALSILLALAVACEAPPPAATEVSASMRAIATLPPKNGARLTVTTPAFTNGSDIPFENTQYKGNTFPGLSWSAGPSETQSYAVIIQDTDGKSGASGLPILHWTIGNIPPGVTTLASGMTTPPTGSSYGPNYQGANHPYSGPATPNGPKHRYHFQVFALDTMLPADAFASYEAMTAAMKDHVLASGEVTGLGQAMRPWSRFRTH